MKTNNPLKIIGVIVKDLHYPFYASLATGIEQYAESKGYSVILASSNNNPVNEKKFSRLLSTRFLDGIIIDPVMEDNVDTEYLYNLKMTNFPFVLLEDVGNIQTNIVTTDSLKAVKRTVKYLIESGHKKIVHFSGPPNSYYTKKHIAGFKLAFSESSLVFNKKMVVQIGASYHDGYYKTLNFFNKLNTKDYPTAIVCFNDHQALAVMLALKELQIQVPQDISIVGYDDIFSANACPIPLTTIRSSGHKIGVAAAKLLIKNIESKTTEKKYERIELKTEFIVGESSRKLN